MGGSEAQLFFLRAAACHQYAIHVIQKSVSGVNQIVDEEAAASATKTKKKRKPKKKKSKQPEGFDGVFDDLTTNERIHAVLANLSDSLNQAKFAVERIEKEKGVPEEDRLKFVDENGDNPVEAFLRQAMAADTPSLDYIGERKSKAIETIKAVEAIESKAEDVCEEKGGLREYARKDPMANPPRDAEGNLDIRALARRGLNNLDPTILERERVWVQETIKKRVQLDLEKEEKIKAIALIAARNTTDVIPKKNGPYKPPPGLPLLRAGPGITNDIIELDMRFGDSAIPDVSKTDHETYRSSLESSASQIKNLALRSIRDMSHFLSFFSGPHSAIFEHSGLEKCDPYADPELIVSKVVSDEEKFAQVKDFVSLVPSSVLAFQAYEDCEENIEAVRAHTEKRRQAIVDELAALEPDTISSLYQVNFKSFNLKTYHPLLIECYYIIALNYLLIGEWEVAAKWHRFIARLVESCEGYPIFLPARRYTKSSKLLVWDRVTTLKLSWDYRGSLGLLHLFLRRCLVHDGIL
jgi:hypothetical protein